MAKIDFYGKQQVYNWHLQIPTPTLVINKEKTTKKDSNTISIEDNIVIKGDNLKGLKALIPYFHNGIDLIYIDPPYNTGNKSIEGGFAYNDDCDTVAFRDWINKSFINGDDMSKHDKWCCMMWPRLQIAKELLNQNGVIFISIDDYEIGFAKLLCDEIFGEDKCAGIVHRKKNRKPHNAGNTMSISHEFILVYYKENSFKLAQEFAEMKTDEKGNYAEYPIFKSDKKIRTYSFKPGLKVFCDLKKGFSTAARNASLNIEVLDDPIIKDGVLMNEIRVKGKYCLTDENGRLSEAMEQGNIFFNSNGVPKEKRYRGDEDYKVANHYWDIEGGTNEDGDEELKKLFDIKGENTLFKYPKPTALIKKVVSCIPRKKLRILDFFGGSGSTGHAILDINNELEDEDKHHFILIEQQDYIDTITTERLKKADSTVEYIYADLKEPVNPEKMLTGEELPTFEELAGQICANTFNMEYTKDKLVDNKYYIGEKNGSCIFLLYENDIDWLSSDKSALTEEKLEEIEKSVSGIKKQLIIYATSRFMSHEELVSKNVAFLKIPFNI